MSLPATPRVIALANQKGGVGKTTTAINLGTALAAIGEEVLIVDLDPQGNASTGLGIDRKSRAVSTYDLLLGEATLDEIALPTAVPQVSVAPSTLDLLGVELEIAGMPDRAYRLRQALAAAQGIESRPKLHLRPGRLPAVAQPPDHQRHGGVALRPGAAAVRVLRPGRAEPAPAHRRAGQAVAQSGADHPRHRADHVRQPQFPVRTGGCRRARPHGRRRSTRRSSRGMCACPRRRRTASRCFSTTSRAPAARPISASPPRSSSASGRCGRHDDSDSKRHW